MKKVLNIVQWGLVKIDFLGLWLGLLSLRLLMAWEFGESGFEKLHGDNWFADIQDQFPWPLNWVPADVSWQLATGLEILGAFALLIGLGTRFFSVSLIVLTVVAILTAHWPESWSTVSELLKGYALTDKGFGNFKLPVIFIAMLLPLVFSGPGGLSVDAWLRARFLAHPKN